MDPLGGGEMSLEQAKALLGKTKKHKKEKKEKKSKKDGKTKKEKKAGAIIYRVYTLHDITLLRFSAQRNVSRGSWGLTFHSSPFRCNVSRRSRDFVPEAALSHVGAVAPQHAEGAYSTCDAVMGNERWALVEG